MPDQRPALIENLRAFQKKPFREASLEFFRTLGYVSDRSQPINSLAELQNSFDENGLLTETSALISRWLSVHLLFQLAGLEIKNSIENTPRLGLEEPVSLKEIKSYLFFAIDLDPAIPTSRTELSRITRSLNRLFPMPVLILFRCGEKISLSIINRRLNMRDGTRDVLTRVSLIRDIHTSEPHRAHLDLLDRFSFHTLRPDLNLAKPFVSLDNGWQKLLSTQELNERFYRELVDWFTWATSEIKLAQLPDCTATTPKARQLATQQFTVRLICRTLFTWFLKEMRLIPPELLELFDPTDRRRVLTTGEYDPEANHYYRGILQNIFFQALNKPMDQRRKSGPEARNDRSVENSDLKKLAYLGKNHLPENFDYSLFDRIPYLNGGLFDALPEDNASDTIEDGALKIPNKLFHARREDGFTITVGSGTRSFQKPVEGLNRLLDRYRFTVAENTPLVEDVALDPELLGLVFENLLAEIDPDLSDAELQNIRKASGSFYTPRRIVDYMVNEALYLHLRTRFQETQATPAELKSLQNLFYELNENPDFSPIARRVVEQMEATRILDPACGSGAFPMGMLHRMVEILAIVDPDNTLWKSRLLERLPAHMRADAQSGMDGKSYDYLRKLGLIQKNLYGLDIQPLAALIAKLRFFLTLVIEQDVNPENSGANYGLEPMPNLETNLLCANSLNQTEHDLLSGDVFQALRSAREEYYQPDTTRQRRDELALKIGGQLAAIYPGFAQETKGIVPTGETLLDRDKMRTQQDTAWFAEWFKHATLAAPFFNVETFFPELLGENGNHSPFHIVIGNPPYGGTPISDDVKNYLGLAWKEPYGAFIARFIGDPARATPLAPGGVLAYIVSDTFMTIKSHRPLRLQMMKNRIHKMIRVNKDTFKATVNCAIILCQRGTPLEDQTCLMADLTNLSIHNEFERFLHILQQTEGAGQLGRRQNVSNQTYALYHYPQNLIATNSNLPFFVASPKLFALMNDTSAPVSFETIGDREQVPVRSIETNGETIGMVKVGDIAEVKVGLQTGDNQAYLFQNPAAWGNYRSLEDSRKFLLTESDISSINADDELRNQIAQNGISKDDQGSKSYFGGRYIVPYDKGGGSDSDDGWMPNYWVPTDYFIDWSNSAVERMKSLTLEEKNKMMGKTGGNSKLTSRFQNTEFYFQTGITFSDTGFYAPTFRINCGTVFDVMGMTIFGDIDPLQNCSLLCSKTSRYLIKNFVNTSVHTQVDGLKITPLPAFPKNASQLGSLAQAIVLQQKNNPRYDYASNEQLEIDRLVYEAYGLDEADIREVEDWYARRYPKLARVQKERLAAKRGQTIDELAPPTVIHFFCDESRHLPHDGEPFMLLGLVACPREQVRPYHLELRELCRTHGLTDDYEMKWTHVRPGKFPFYQAVLDWFLSKEDLSFRALLLPDKEKIYQRLPEESQDLAYYRLYAQLLRSALTEDGHHRAYLDLKDTRGGEKVAETEKHLRLLAGDSEEKKILGLQQIQSHEARLLQLADVLLGAVGAAHRYKTLPPPKQALITQLEDGIGSPLNWDTAALSQKMALSTYRDIDSLVS